MKKCQERMTDPNGAQQLMSTFGERAFGSRTIAVGVSEGGVYVSSSYSGASYLKTLQSWLRPGEILVPTVPKVAGETLHHAEQAMLTSIVNSAPGLISMGATRPMCLNGCANAVLQAGVIPATPFYQVQLTYSTYTEP